MRGKRIRDRMKFTRCGHAGIMKMKRDKKRSKAAIVLTTFRKRRVSIWIRLLERGTNTYATLYVRVNTTVRDEPTTPPPLWSIWRVNSMAFDRFKAWKPLTFATSFSGFLHQPLLSTLLRYFLRHFEKMANSRWLIFDSLLVCRRFRNRSNDKYNFGIFGD